MARLGCALLLLVTLTLGSAEEREERRLVVCFDSAIDSFYIDVARGPLHSLSSVEEQAEVLGKTASYGVACGLICRYWLNRLSGREAPLLVALLKGSAEAEQTAETREKEEVHSMGSYLHRFAQFQLECLQRHWQGSTLLALAVAVAMLSSYKTTIRRRRTSSSCQVKCTLPISLPPVSLPAQNYSVVYYDISSLTQAKTTSVPPQCGSAVYFDISSVRHGSPSSSADSNDFDCESDLDQADYLMPSRQAVGPRSKDKKERPRMRLPGPEDRWNAFDNEPCTYEYENGGFVRKRTEEYEKRIDFHRTASSQEFV